MPPPDACAICSGPLVLRYPGSADGLTAEDLSPTCHQPGVHGDLYACTRCGTVQQADLPSGEALLDLYRAMRDDAYLREEEGRRATARRLLDLVEGQVRPGRLLDVGCGHGLLLDEARSRGWDTLGLEPSRAGREYARERLGLEVREGTLADLEPARDGGFDAIVLADVIEHFDDPVAAVRACAALLAPAGVTCVVTPDPASRTALLAGARWWGYLPAHTYLLPRRTLRAVLGGEGLDPVVDVGLKRSFTLGYWMGGLAERGGAARTVADLASRLPVTRRRLTLSLGDERVVVARRGAAVPGADAVGANGAAARAVPFAAS